MGFDDGEEGRGVVMVDGSRASLFFLSFMKGVPPLLADKALLFNSLRRGCSCKFVILNGLSLN
jgi:hypothetical protein